MLLSLVACETDNSMFYKGEAGLYFVDGGDVDSVVYSFTTTTESFIEVRLPVETLGRPVDIDRNFTVQIDETESTALEGEDYELNLIDTPGHVDFTYEVSRSLAACEGAILIVDATQGVEAQTLANAYLAIDNNLEILPVINKIDLPSARPEEVKKEIEDVVGIPAMHAPCISAKDGTNIDQVLKAIITKIPMKMVDLNV